MAQSSWDETVVLDDSHLNEFTGGDRDLQKQVLAIFLEHAPKYLETLCASGNDTWRSDAHKLKGAARSIGAWRLACEAERAEQMGYPGVDDPRRARVSKELLTRLEQTVLVIKNRDHDK